MSLSDKTLHVCSCNATMPLDAAALARALGVVGELPVHTQLCQKELARFADVAAGDLIVACTQEARLFGDVADDAGKTHTITLRQYPRERGLVGARQHRRRPRSRR